MNPRQTKSKTDFQRALREIEGIFNTPSIVPDLAALEQLNSADDEAAEPQPPQAEAVQDEPHQSGQ